MHVPFFANFEHWFVHLGSMLLFVLQVMLLTVKIRLDGTCLKNWTIISIADILNFEQLFAKACSESKKYGIKTVKVGKDEAGLKVVEEHSLSVNDVVDAFGNHVLFEVEARLGGEGKYRSKITSEKNCDGQ